MCLNNTESDDLQFLRNLSLEELMQIKGIGKVKAIQIKAICELANRMSKPANYQKMRIKAPKDLAKILIPEMQNETREILKLVILNNKNEILKMMNIAEGNVNTINISMQSIFSEPLKMNAPEIALAHNHPTGDATPSNKDIKFTNLVYDNAMLLNIELIDHLVIGKNSYTSILSKIAQETEEEENEKE